MIGGLDVLFGKESSKIKIQLYWDGLADIPIDVVRDGFAKAKQTLDRYPSIAKWRQCCELAAREKEKHRPNLDFSQKLALMSARGASVDEMTGELCEIHYNCERCEDRGWAYFHAQTKQPMTCDEIVGKRDEVFVRRCECRGGASSQLRPAYATITEDRPWNHG
jgi:hypothetical protein